MILHLETPMATFRAYLIRLLVLAAFLVPAIAYAQSASTSIEFALTSGTPIAGTNLEFTVRANNEGPDPAATTAVTFDVPTNSTFVSLVTPGGWSCITPAPGGTGTITCSIASFVPGSDAFVLTVATVSTSPQGTPVTITGSISSATPDPGPNDNAGQLTIVLIWQANLAVVKSGPANAFAGAIIDYTISIDNPGPSPAADLDVSDTFAAPLRFVSVVAPGWTCTTPAVGAPGTVHCTNPEIPAGTTNLTMQLDTPTSTLPASVTNGVSVSASSDPGAPRSASSTALLTTSADLTIAKASVPATPVAGQTLTYTITVTQNGPSDAANVVLTDPLPAALAFQSVTAAGWNCTTPIVGASGTLNCTRTSLSPGASTITIGGLLRASTPSGALVSNTASLTSDTPDPALPNTATANATAATQADLSISITDGPDPVVRGRNLTYQVVVTNSGPSDASNPTLSVVLDPALGFASAIPAAGWNCVTPAIGASGTILCSAAAIPGGASANFVIVVTSPLGPNPGAAGSVVVSTSATAGTSTPDPNSANNAAVATTLVTNSTLIPTVSAVILAAMTAMLVLFALFRLRARRIPPDRP
jgi:uncharacterized repeat protein (TIGR01451 family)